MVGKDFGVMRKDSRHAHAWIEDVGSPTFASLAEQTGWPSVAALEERRGRSPSAFERTREDGHPLPLELWKGSFFKEKREQRKPD